MSPSEVLGIAGAGVIATGLAACASRTTGHILWARSQASAARATSAIVKACERLGDAYRPENVRVTTELSDLRSASFIVEAIAEDLALKIALLGRLQEIVREDAVVTSTTSSLCVQALAAATGHPERFAGLHVFNPVPKMRLVEIAFPNETTPAARKRVSALCISLDKEAIEAPAIPGFVVNGLLFPYLFSAVNYMEQHDVQPEMIDACMQLGAGHPMGPIALLDYIGLDVSVAIGDSLGCSVPDRLRILAAEGATGKKVGRGLYPASHYLS